jgi:hypothetical protein
MLWLLLLLLRGGLQGWGLLDAPVAAPGQGAEDTKVKNASPRDHHWYRHDHVIASKRRVATVKVK